MKKTITTFLCFVSGLAMSQNTFTWESLDPTPMPENCAGSLSETINGITATVTPIGGPQICADGTTGGFGGTNGTIVRPGYNAGLSITFDVPIDISSIYIANGDGNGLGTVTLTPTGCNSSVFTHTETTNGHNYVVNWVGVTSFTIENNNPNSYIMLDDIHFDIHTPPSQGTDIQTACGSYTWIDGNNYTASNNTATHTITGGAANGCDSTVALNLTINPLPNSATTTSGITISATASGLDYQWINCSDNSEIAGADAQSYTPTANGSYAVIVDNGTCSDTSACVNITTVGLSEMWNTELVEVYPNPANDHFTVKLSNWEDANITVYDAMGKLVHQQVVSGEKTSVNSASYPKGVYLVNIQNKDAKQTKRLVIQ